MNTLYGKADATYQALGAQAGIKQLVDRFYDHMHSDPAFKTIRDWHPEDLTQSRDKLTLFLCGWCGGPRLYHEKYGSISIPGVHAHLQVMQEEMHMWLDCMHAALLEQQAENEGFPDALIEYLLTQLARPAEMIRQSSANR